VKKGLVKIMFPLERRLLLINFTVDVRLGTYRASAKKVISIAVSHGRCGSAFLRAVQIVHSLCCGKYSDRLFDKLDAEIVIYVMIYVVIFSPKKPAHSLRVITAREDSTTKDFC